MNHSGIDSKGKAAAPLKVLHIITRFDKGGSAENTFLTVAGLDRRRYEVTLVTGPYKKKNDSEDTAIERNEATLQKLGVKRIVCRHLVRELNPVRDCAALFGLCRIILRERPDIVHTHTSKAGIAGRWAAWICRVPVIIHTPHGHVFFGYFGAVMSGLFVFLERLTARITDRLVMLTSQEMNDHLERQIAPAEKFVVIHSGVDLEQFQQPIFTRNRGRELLKIDETVIVIGTVGRLTAIKGQDVLITAFAGLAQRRDDVLLVVLGEGEKRAELEEQVKCYKIERRVIFPGWRADVAAVMAAFDVFCLPSLNEGMGRVVVEAMAMGLPVVASDVGGIKDLVSDGESGLLVSPGDPDRLAEALAYICDNPQMRRLMGENGRRAAPSWSSSAMLAKIEHLYQQSRVKRKN